MFFEDTRFDNFINLLQATLIKYRSEVLFNNNKLLYEITKMFQMTEERKYLGLYSLKDSTINPNNLHPKSLSQEYIASHYINCKQYIEYSLEQAKRYETEVEKSIFIDFLYNLLKDKDYIKKLMGILILNADGVKEYINATHPLMLLDIMFQFGEEITRPTKSRWNGNKNKLKIIIFEYPNEYEQKDIDSSNIEGYVKQMKPIAMELSRLRLESIDRKKTLHSEQKEKVIYVDSYMKKIYNQNVIRTNEQKFIIPVDRMASISVVPFYGWNYVHHKEAHSMIGYPLFNYINITGNLSINTGENNGSGSYCTGSLPKNMNGLNSLKGNNLSSAYRTNCIDISKNYSWIQANLLVCKYLIEVYKGVSE